jgi:hypothetical protein
MTDVKAESKDHALDQPHPSTFSPATFALLIVLAIFGAIIGIQLILQLGVTPNTSIIGALVAMILARIPLTLFARYRSVHVQNLAQSNISAATFGAANSLLVPIGVPFLLDRGDLFYRLRQRRLDLRPLPKSLPIEGSHMRDERFKPRQGSRLVRFGPLCGLKSDIS